MPFAVHRGGEQQHAPGADLRLDQRGRAGLVAQDDAASPVVGDRLQQLVLEEARRRQPLAARREPGQQGLAPVDRRQPLGGAGIDGLADLRARPGGGRAPQAEGLRQHAVPPPSTYFTSALEAASLGRATLARNTAA